MVNYKHQTKYEQMRIPFIPTSEIEQGSEDVGYKQPLDLNSLLIDSPASTFLLRAKSSRCGVKRGDILVVDRSVTPQSGQLVIAVESGDMCLQKAPTLEVWGVVRYVVHRT